MKKYKNPLGVTSQFSFCGIPFRLDTYSGCSFTCSYCYSHQRGGGYDSSKIKVADPFSIIKTFDSAFKKPNITTGIIAQYIRRKMPVHFGGMSDPFQPIELKEKVSEKVLKYLCRIKYPVVISTKSTLLSNSPYLEIIKSNPNIIIQVSFSTLNYNFSKAIEPFSPSPQERLKCLERLSKEGINTTIRWQPYIIGISELPIDFVKKISDTGICHLIIEFLKLPIDNKISTKNGRNPFPKIRTFYLKKKSKVVGRELILPPNNKMSIINELKRELNKIGVSLGVGDNELHYLSDTFCCCGLDKFRGFEKWNKYQISYAIRSAKDKKITFAIIKNQWKPTGGIDEFVNPNSRIEKKNGFNTVSTYIENRWENTQSVFNPTKYFGVDDTGLKDEKGMRIFRIKTKRKV